MLPLIPDVLAGPILVVDTEGRIQKINRALASILGKQEEEVRGLRLDTVMIPEGEQSRYHELLPKVLSGEVTEPVEMTIRCAKGKLRSILWKYTRIQNEAGEVEGILSTGTDLSEMRILQAQEQALKESEARFSGIVEMASDAIISVDSAQRIVLFNRGASGIFGYTPEEILGSPLSALLPVDARGAHGHQIAGFLESPVPARPMASRGTIRGLRKDGSEFAAEASIVKLTVAGELRATVLLRDVSERARFTANQVMLANLEQALARSLDVNDTLDALVTEILPHMADLCIIDLMNDDAGEVQRVRIHPGPPEGGAPDGDGRLTGGHAPHTRRLFDDLEPHLFPILSRADLADFSIDEVTLPRLADHAPHCAMVAPLVARGRCLGALYLFRLGDGSPRAGQPRIHLPFDEEDLSLLKDIGRRAGMAIENARLYRDAQRAIDARDEVLGIVSHDLGNPLQAIFIGLEALGRSRTGRTEGRPGQDEYYFTAIRRSAEVMAHLIQDLLEIRRMEAGHLELKPVIQNPGPHVAATLDVLLPLAQVKGITIDNRVPMAGLPEVSLDGARIQQVLSNLVGNAIKHTPEGGTITIESDLVDREVHVHVHDTGEGIPPEDLERVFERFWRAERGRARGIGLGLAIARTLVRAHGGRIWATSEEGTGSTFSFSLPLRS